MESMFKSTMTFSHVDASPPKSSVTAALHIPVCCSLSFCSKQPRSLIGALGGC